MLRFGIACGAAAVLLVLAAPGAQAQTRTVTTIVPFGPGGAPDTIARLMAESINKNRAATMVVENRPGAGAIIGTELVQRAKPDGNTLLVIASGFLLNAHLRKVNYNPHADFAPICHLASAPVVITVDAKSPYRTLDDLIKAAREKPGTLTAGSPGPGTSHHIIFEGFKQRAKVDMTYVPYATTGPAVSAVLGGHITAAVSDYGSLAGPLQAGQLRALAVSSSSRMAAQPDVPTFAEAGLTGLEWEGWFGLVAPAKTPKDVMDELIGWYRAALEDKAATGKLAGLQLTPRAICGADFAEFLKKNDDAFAEVIRAGNITLKK